MSLLPRSAIVVSLLIAFVAELGCSGHRRGESKSVPLNGPVNEDTAIRLFFNPGEYFHDAFILKAVQSTDARLNTTELVRPGKTVYISMSEMGNLRGMFSQLPISWQDSPAIERFSDQFYLPVENKLAITVVTSRGTAKSGIAPEKICETLAPMDAVLKNYSIRHEFQMFQHSYHCVINE